MSKKPVEARPCKPAIAAGGAMVIALGCALIWSFPLMLAPDKVLLGHPGDALTTLLRWENWQPSLRYVERPLLNIVGSALAGSLGPVAAYNALVLASFPLSALTAFLLLFRIVRHAPSAMVGAVAFAISPFHWAHSLGHLYEAHIQWIPLVAMSLLATVERPGLLRAAGLVASSALLVTSSFYYGFFAATVATPVMVAWAIALLVRGRARRLGLILLAAAGAFLATLPVTYSYITWLTRTPAPSAQHFDDLFRYSARVREYVSPGPFSALGRIRSPTATLGSLHFSNEVEQSLFLGWVLMALGAWGLSSILRRHSQSHIRRGELAALAAVGLVAALCSGPPVARVAGLSIRLPSYYLGGMVPFFRTYARMGIFVHLAVCAAGAAGLAAFPRRRLSALCAGAMLLTVVEYTPVPPPRTLRLFPLRGVHGWLADQPENALMVEYPMDSRVTPRTSVRGWTGRASARHSVEELISVDLRHMIVLGRPEAQDLARAGVHHVLLHDRNPDPPLQVYKDRPDRGLNLPGVWPAMPDRDALTLVAHFPQTILLRLPAAQTTVSLSPGEGLAPWQEGPRSVGMPLGARSHHLAMQNVTRWPVKVGLVMRVVPTETLRELRLVFNGARVGTYPAVDTTWIALSDLEVLPGRNYLRIEGVDARGELPAGPHPVGLLLGARITEEEQAHEL